MILQSKKPWQSQNTVRKAIIDPNGVDEKLLDEMHIDQGVRSLVAQLLKRGYDTLFGCDGYGRASAYINFVRGTGDGSFERMAESIGFKEEALKGCCKQRIDEENPFCSWCGASTEAVQYKRPLEGLDELV